MTNTPGILYSTSRMSDRHLTVNGGIQRDDHGIRRPWQTRWLVAVHLDSLVRQVSGVTHALPHQVTLLNQVWRGSGSLNVVPLPPEAQCVRILVPALAVRERRG